jgi:hypothetical protein
MGEVGNWYKFWLGNQKREDNLKDLGVDGDVLL